MYCILFFYNSMRIKMFVTYTNTISLQGGTLNFSHLHSKKVLEVGISTRFRRIFFFRSLIRLLLCCSTPRALKFVDHSPTIVVRRSITIYIVYDISEVYYACTIKTKFKYLRLDPPTHPPTLTERVESGGRLAFLLWLKRCHLCLSTGDQRRQIEHEDSTSKKCIPRMHSAGKRHSKLRVIIFFFYFEFILVS